MKIKKVSAVEPTFIENVRDVCSAFPNSSKVTQAFALEMLAVGRIGAEWEALDVLARSVVEGEDIDPLFQAVVNALVAKAVFSGKLPARAKGRPKASAVSAIGWLVANEYFDMTDSGTGYDDAARKLSEKFNKSERQIMRFVKANRKQVGESIAERAFTRAAREVLSDMDFTFDRPVPRDYGLEVGNIVASELAKRCNPFEVLEESQRKWIESVTAG